MLLFKELVHLSKFLYQHATDASGADLKFHGSVLLVIANQGILNESNFGSGVGKY
jgi:hypothetical protein